MTKTIVISQILTENLTANFNCLIRIVMQMFTNSAKKVHHPKSISDFRRRQRIIHYLLKTFVNITVKIFNMPQLSPERIPVSGA